MENTFYGVLLLLAELKLWEYVCMIRLSSLSSVHFRKIKEVFQWVECSVRRC